MVSVRRLPAGWPTKGPTTKLALWADSWWPYLVDHLRGPGFAATELKNKFSAVLRGDFEGRGAECSRNVPHHKSCLFQKTRMRGLFLGRAPSYSARRMRIFMMRICCAFACPQHDVKLHSHHVSFQQRSSMNVAGLALPQSQRRRFRSQCRGLCSLRRCMRLPGMFL